MRDNAYPIQELLVLSRAITLWIAAIVGRCHCLHAKELKLLYRKAQRYTLVRF
jgi:hypothetical protein